MLIGAYIWGDNCGRLGSIRWKKRKRQNHHTAGFDIAGTESVSDLDLCDEMNEELKSEINIVEGEFELTKKEVSLIKEKFPNLPDMKTWPCKNNPDKQTR